MKSTIATVLILSAVVMLSGCRIGAAVFEGGDVVSESGTRHCFEGRTCEFQVSDTNFSESFTAQPRDGYEFVKWRKGDGFLCADSTNPTCTVSNVGTEGIAVIEAFVASDQMFYIMPEFTCVVEDCPLPAWRALDEAVVAVEEASVLVEEYVAVNGNYPDSAIIFGLNTSYRDSTILRNIQVSEAPRTGSSIFIEAAVYNSVWDGSNSPDHFAVSYFSLSGSTNADNSMTWECLPYSPLTNSRTIPYAYLPPECRG